MLKPKVFSSEKFEKIQRIWRELQNAKVLAAAFREYTKRKANEEARAVAAAYRKYINEKLNR